MQGDFYGRGGPYEVILLDDCTEAVVADLVRPTSAEAIGSVSAIAYPVVLYPTLYACPSSSVTVVRNLMVVIQGTLFDHQQLKRFN